MYKYKIVKIKHSSWTGKPKENISDVINDYAENGWRLVQVIRANSYAWGTSGFCTEVIFEKTLEDYMKDVKERQNYRVVGELV